MNTNDRIEMAEQKLSSIGDLLITLRYVRANNKFLLYSDTLVEQIGRSYAANAYNIIADGMFGIEVARICALWDRASNERQAIDRDSLPALTWLISSEEVSEVIAERFCDKKKGKKRTKLELENARKQIQQTIGCVRKIESSNLHNGLRNFRDKHVAHALARTNKIEGFCCQAPSKPRLGLRQPKT